MKNNIRITRNEANPSIPPRPDFAKLAANAAKLAKPFYMKTWFWGTTGFAVITIVASVVFLGKPASNLVKKSHNDSTAKNIIHPIANLDIAYDTFTVNVAQGDTLVYKGCTKIIVPPAAINKTNGAQISTTKVVYREFQNQTEIMTSGIPMQYDTAGKKLLLESGGMFEFRSIENDEQINPEKSIEIKMCSQHNQQGFNWYALDDKTGQWKYIKPVTMPTPVEDSDSMKTATLENKAARKVPSAPQSVSNITIELPKKRPTPEPKRKSAKGYTFTVPEPDVPELAIYSNLVFEVLPGQNFNPNSLPDYWDEISVKPTAVFGQYLLTLKDSKQTLKYKAIPVFETEKDYQQALKDFKKQETEYNKKLAKQEEERKKQAEQNVQLDFQAQPTTPTSNLNYSSMAYSLTINKFGYYNSDRPIKNISISKQIQYEVAGGGSNQPQVYQYFLNRNAVMVNYNYSPGKINITYNKEDECVLVVFLNQSSSIAVVSPEKYKSQIVNGNASTIAFEKVDLSFNNTKDLHSFIVSKYGTKQ